MSLKISVIYGSTRDGRQGIKFAKYIKNELTNRGNKAILIDPMNINIETLTKRYIDYEKGLAPSSLEEMHQELNSSDAFVIVSAEYNHFMPPALVNVLNHFHSEYQRKPSAITTYSVSPFGGVRVSSPLRAFLTQLGMPPIPAMIHAPFVNKNFNEDGERVSADKVERNKEFIKFSEELEWYANALKVARNLT
ncbi:MAG: NADPH-dependent FMN reductase [Alphaproteobacteria bacterium]|jgi:NAD(P)H-dependent FMN reductase|tara:strand:+ start:1601 stop:2179 length:579 start_codon:yes stop_codon:yes gene_type:complete